MSIKQVSVFLENKKGRLREVTEILAEGGINIRSLSLADTENYGILRMIVNDPDRCVKVLKEKDLAARVTPVLAVEVSDEPGGLLKILNIFEANGINIEYMYATFEKNADDKAVMVFRVESAEEAEKVLEGFAIKSVDQRIFI